MEAAIRSHQVGTGQQSAQQPQSDLSGVRGSPASGPPQHPSHSMSQYSQPRSNASGGINEVHRSSATSSPYQISQGIPHTYVDQRSRVRPTTNTFSGASAAPSKTNYNWQPNAQFEYAPRTTMHQPTMGTVPTNFVTANFAHAGFAPRVSVSIPQQQPASQQPPPSQGVPNAPRQITEYIAAGIRDSPAALLQASQTGQQRPQPDPGGTQQQQQQAQQNSQPAYKKPRLGEPPYQPPQQTNSLHPAAAPTSIPVRLHHATYDKTGQPLQSSPVVVQVASAQRLHQNPIVGATAEIQYQSQKPPQQQPTHQISTAASPQAPQQSQQPQPQQQLPSAPLPQQQQQQPPPSQQSQPPSQQQQQQQVQSAASQNSKVLSMLKIDTREPLTIAGASNGGGGGGGAANNNNVGGGGYHPKTEAISPAGSPKLSKDDLLQQISSVDSSMMSLEERKRSLKEKERTLLEQKDEGMSIEVPEQPTTHRTLAQQIYAENKKKANDSHAILTALNFKGQTFELPLYNQPSDADVCRKIHEHYLTFRSSLLLHLRKIKSERAQRSQELADKYAKLSADWQKRVEKIEGSIKRKNREFKNRELFEKVFVELRKQREDKERFNRVGSRVKSEADFEVIVDGLQEQAQEDKKMRSYAVIPPIMFDSRQRRLVFQNENGSKVDMEAELSAYKTLNLWTTGEKEIFRDKYVQQAKNFGFIASNLERKNAQDCVRYYYLSKKDVKYKQLLRKSSKRTRSTKNLPKISESQSLLDLMTTGVTTRLQRKSRNTTSRSSTNSQSAAASAADSQTTNSSTAARSTTTTSLPSAPLPTVTVTVTGSMKSEEPDNENDPLGMTETTTPSPAQNAANSTSGTAADSTSSSSSSSSGAATAATTSITTTNASFLPTTAIKSEPDADVVMKTESDSTSNGTGSWTSVTVYPPNGLKHEIKTEDIKMEQAKSAASDETGAPKKDETKDEKKIDIKREPNDDKENDEGKRKKPTPMDVEDENSWNSSEPSSAKKPRIDESGANDSDKGLLYPCFVCKQDNCSRTRPLEKAKAQQYGLSEDNIPAGARVCNNCQCKAVKSRFSNTNCPLPTCPNPKDRVKRFRNLPSRLFELSPEERDPIIKELQIPPNVTKCCSACLTRIKRKMGAHLLGTTSLSDDEIQQFRKQLQDIGPKWSQLAEQLGKSATVLKTFYYNYKKKYGFDQAVNEYYKLHANEDRRAITDGDESDVSVTSSDDNGSDALKSENDADGMDTKVVVTVKVEPLVFSSVTPSTTITTMQTPASKDAAVKSEPQPPTSTAPSQIIDDRLPPPLGQPPPLLSSQQVQNLSTSAGAGGMSRAHESHPLISIMRTKKHSEEYDSSATETADEENESSPANRQSPKAVFGGKGLNPATTISMVPSGPQAPPQNGPLSNVRDVLHNVIERTLKNPLVVQPSVPPLKHNPLPADSSPDVSFVGSYRQDPNKVQIQPQRRVNNDGLQTLATLSVVNMHGGPPSGPVQSQLHPLNISSIAATITPVPPPPQSSLPPRSTPQHLSVQDKDLKYHSVARNIPSSIQQQQHNEPEPQTLDLSIKKPQQQQQQPPERSFPQFQAKAPPPPTGGSIYRGDPAANIPSQQSYLAFHPDRPSKSPSNYIPPPLSPGQRVMGMPPHSMQQPQQIVANKAKVTPKLSPKVHHQMPQQSSGTQVQQINGPKGSITHGTPMNDRGQPITIQNARYDILRQTPPSADNKFGSIIAGTPVNLNDKRVQDYIKNNRHSPATNQPNATSAPTGSPHPTITYRPPGDLSSSTRDLVFSDYMISQQMHNQQVRGGGGGGGMPNTINIISGGPSRSEKDAPSPRSIAHSSSPASLYYADKERDRVGGGQTRTEYLSRSSPADHHNNSTPSPHRTPPPQRQGVIIQRHNNANSKPPSPAPLRQGHFPHHYSQGHDALSNLVDVAVAQQALPVPNDNSRRQQHAPPTSSAESQSSLQQQRERYPFLLPADVMAFQAQHAEMMRRQQHDYNERKEREIMQERERDRERDERDAQRRLDAELAQRNYDRDRMEQMRISYQPRMPYANRLPDEISAQCLINAIITENISRPSDSRDRYQTPHHLSRMQASENNGNSHSPNVINVDVDSSSDLSRHSSLSSLPSKNLKLNDITDAIIAKDPSFGLHHQQGPPPGAYHHLPGQFVRSQFSVANTMPSKTPPTQSHAQQQQQPPSSMSQPMGQEQIIATDQWKMNRRLQQQQMQKEEQMAKSGVNMQGRSTPDDRHIIRMAQSPSPRTKMAYEPVSPPESSSHYHIQPKITINSYDQRNMSMVQDSVAASDENNKFVLKMINHRLAEAMRNDEKYANEHHVINADGKDRRDGVYERPRSGNSAGPGNGISGDKSPAKRESPQVYGNLSRPSSQPGNPAFQPSASMGFMYPYSALTIPQAAGANPIISPKAANEIIDSNRQQQQPPTPQHHETRQVLSENYDALSDED